MIYILDYFQGSDCPYRLIDDLEQNFGKSLSIFDPYAVEDSVHVSVHLVNSCTFYRILVICLVRSTLFEDLSNDTYCPKANRFFSFQFLFDSVLYLWEPKFHPLIREVTCEHLNNFHPF